MKRITDEELAELVRRTEEATAAYMRGDMNSYGDTVVIAMVERQHGEVGGLPDPLVASMTLEQMATLTGG